MEQSAGPESPLSGPLRAVRRFWWLVVLVTCLAATTAVLATLATPTTYTGRASLIVNSNQRAPEQDAVLVTGYVDYFNDLAYQRGLVEAAGLDREVTLSARSAAASPIMLIESTTSDPEYAQSSAADVAEVFQADVNRVRDSEQQAQVAALEARIAQVTAAGGADAPTSVGSLRDQIAEVEADRTNRLQELQFEGGVTTNTPSLVRNVATGAVGGLLVGGLLAVGLARLADDRRRRRRPSGGGVAGPFPGDPRDH